LDINPKIGLARDGENHLRGEESKGPAKKRAVTDVRKKKRLFSTRGKTQEEEKWESLEGRVLLKRAAQNNFDSQLVKKR